MADGKSQVSETGSGKTSLHLVKPFRSLSIEISVVFIVFLILVFKILSS